MDRRPHGHHTREADDPCNQQHEGNRKEEILHVIAPPAVESTTAAQTLQPIFHARLLGSTLIACSCTQLDYASTARKCTTGKRVRFADPSRLPTSAAGFLRPSVGQSLGQQSSRLRPKPTAACSLLSATSRARRRAG